MRCDTVRKKLDRSRRQEVAPRVRERVEAHLSACAGCRRHLARQERLIALLSSAPEPPGLAEGFGERLMAAARQRQAERQLVPGSLWRLRWLWSPALARRRVAQGAVLAGGLLIGVLTGQQTWRSVHPSNPQQAMQADPLAVYELDYLSDAPAGSLAQSYLMLTKAPSHNGT